MKFVFKQLPFEMMSITQSTSPTINVTRVATS